jgi:hypothetical protein
MSIVGQWRNKHSGSNQYATDKINVLPKNENTSHGNEYTSYRYTSSHGKQNPSRRCLLVCLAVEDKRSEKTGEQVRSEETKGELKTGQLRGEKSGRNQHSQEPEDET